MPSKKSDARSWLSELPWTSLLDTEQETSSSRSKTPTARTEKKTKVRKRSGTFLRLGKDRYACADLRKRQ